MTKAEISKLVRQARQHGYFKPGRTVYVNCPVCCERQETEPCHRTFKAPKGKPANIDPVTGDRTVYRLETDTEALDRAMTGHLTDWCGQDHPIPA